MLRFEDLRVRDRQTLDRDFFNRRFRLIAETLAQLGDDVAAVNSDTDRLVTLGLNRVNEVLGPLLSKVQAASENGFLVATSTTPLTISLNLEATLEIDEAYRYIFQPTPYVVLTRQVEGTPEDWATLYVQAYSHENGGLAFKVVQAAGNIGAGEYSDWVISASAGVSVAVLETAAGVEAALTLAEQAALDAQAAADVAEQVLANGPVASVNGQTGVVSLGMSDIPNLTTTLGGKADSNHGHQISAISGLQTALDAKAPSTHAHAISDVTGLQTALNGKAATSHAHAIADVTGLQTALDAKLPASGGALTGALNAADQEISAPKLKDYSLTVNARGSVSGAQTINYASGNYVTATIGGATQFTVSNPPGTGIGGAFFLVLTNGGAAAITWMSGTQWESGVAPGLTASGTDILAFTTHNGGTNWRGVLVAKDVR